MRAPGRQHLGSDRLKGPPRWGWATALRYAMRGMLRFGQERRPQLLTAQSLLLAGSIGIDHADSRFVHRAGQVVWRSENHSYPWLTATQKSSESWSLRDYERGRLPWLPERCTTILLVLGTIQ
jgi:hypothetical protein